jgi:acyl carrier protein
MGLDAVELIMAIEEEFQIAISDSEAAECTTVQDLVELIFSRVRQAGGAQCPSQQCFYLVRKKLSDTLGIQRRAIKPETKLEQIIPKENREKVWGEIVGSLVEGGIFRGQLVRPKWMTWGLLPASLILPLVLFMMFLNFPFFLALVFSLPFFILTYGTTRLYSTDFPDGMTTVKDMIKLVKSLDPRTWSEQEVFIKIRAITAEQLGIDESQVTPEARFIDDLGMG